MADSLVNTDFIRRTITGPDPWCSSHGADPSSDFLGAGMLYYALAYATEARTCLCLGSGGGFVPRLMRQAQRDRRLEGSRTILVDGGPLVAEERKRIWGSPSWLAPDSALRRDYPEIEIVVDLTARAFHDRFDGRISVDFLHIDADHHYDGVKADWDLFRRLVPPGGVITLHDTTNRRPPCGVPQLMEEIAAGGDYDVVNFPIRYGTAVVRKRAGTGQ